MIYRNELIDKNAQSNWDSQFAAECGQLGNNFELPTMPNIQTSKQGKWI